MFDSSVIKQTGQWWKLIVSFCGLLIGVGVVFLAGDCRKRWSAEVFVSVTKLNGGYEDIPLEFSEIVPAAA